jgi:hypothetical protein
VNGFELRVSSLFPEEFMSISRFLFIFAGLLCSGGAVLAVCLAPLALISRGAWTREAPAPRA